MRILIIIAALLCAASSFAGNGFVGIGGNSAPLTDGASLTGITAAQVGAAPRYAYSSYSGNRVITCANSDRISVVGDSYSQSSYSLPDKAWISNLSEFSDYNYENYGVGGNTAASALYLLRANTHVYHASLGYQDYKSKYTVVPLYANDMGAGNWTGTNASTTTTLTGGSSWNANMWAGASVNIFGGTGNGNTITVISNTSTTLTFAVQGFTPDSTTQYRLGFTADQYVTAIENLGTAIESLGSIPILATEHTSTYGDFVDTQLKAIAEKHKWMWMDTRPFQRDVLNLSNTAYWVGGHPGTRTNGIIGESYRYYLNQLPRPRQSLKLFKVRGSDPGSSASLLFSDNGSRAVLWQEIGIGQNTLDSASLSHYDDLATSHGEVAKNSDYLTLQGGGNVTFSSFALASVVLPASERSVNAVTLHISDTSATVYALNTLNSPSWVSVPCSGGACTITSLAGNMRGDRIDFLINNGSGITLNNVWVSWAGTEDKPQVTPAPFTEPKLATSAEMLTTTGFGSGSTSGWTVVGSLTSSAPTDSLMPSGTTYRVTVDSSNYLKQAVTLPSTTQEQIVQIAVWARNFPAVCVPANYPGSCVITPTSYDFRTLKVQFQGADNPSQFETTNGNRAIYTDIVGLMWKKVIFEVIVPASTTARTLWIMADGTTEIASASVKIKGVSADPFFNTVTTYNQTHGGQQFTGFTCTNLGGTDSTCDFDFFLATATGAKMSAHRYSTPNSGDTDLQFFVRNNTFPATPTFTFSRYGYFVINNTQTPASNAACTAGGITWDASYIYVCTATGVWKRSALTGGY